MIKLLRVLIIDDSVVFRLSFFKILKTFSEVGKIDYATGGNVGLEMVALHKPDLIFCDIEMSEEVGDGISTLRKLKAEYPSIGVVMISGMNAEMAKKTIQSLAIGAIDFIAKPNGSDPKENERNLRKLVRPVISLFSTRKYISSIFENPVENRTQHSDMDNIGAIVIGSSTGGPRSLMSILPKIPSDFSIPIFIVQHMDATYIASLSEYLQEISQVKIKEAESGEIVHGGMVYVAPGEFNMKLSKNQQGEYCIELTEGRLVDIKKPSIDVFFKSVADIMQEDVISVILGGMGRDGLEGVRALKRKKCLSIVQNKETSIVYDVPAKIIEAGLADEIISDVTIGERIVAIVNNH